MQARHTTLPLNTLVPWPDNPRTVRDEETITQTAANIDGQGLIMPLIAVEAPGGVHFTIDGETRRQALNRLVNDNKLAADAPVDVKLLPSDTSQAQLLAIAIAANAIREDMNDVDYFMAFSKLAREGMKPGQIAALFSMTTRQVHGLLALGHLVPEALELLRSGKRAIDWARAMTMASPVQQQKIVSRIEANPHEFATPESVRAEINNAGIPETAALFDPSLLKNSLVVNLFSDVFNDGVFTDVDAFWQLQNAEIDKLEASLRATHKDVLVIRGTRFNDTGWTAGADPAEATAVIIVHDDGSVTTKEGMVPPADALGSDGDSDMLADLLDDAAANVDLAQPAAAEIDPLAKATRETSTYLDVQARMSMRLAINDNPRFAKAALVAATMARNASLATPLASIPVSSIDDFMETPMGAMLAVQRERRDRIAVAHGLAGLTDTAELVSRLMAVNEDELDLLMAWAVSESCRASLNADTFAAAQAAGVGLFDDWTIDNAYVETLSNAQLRALAEEILPASLRPAERASIRTVKQAIQAWISDQQAQGTLISGSGWLPPQVAALSTPSQASARASLAIVPPIGDDDDITSGATSRLAA